LTIFILFVSWQYSWIAALSKCIQVDMHGRVKGSRQTITLIYAHAFQAYCLCVCSCMPTVVPFLELVFMWVLWAAFLLPRLKFYAEWPLADACFCSMNTSSCTQLMPLYANHSNEKWRRQVSSQAHAVYSVSNLRKSTWQVLQWWKTATTTL